jgi:hypothetical protein
VFRVYDRRGIRFALWTAHGRDPEVAYLDARLLAIATSELGTTGLQLHGSGISHNILGGARPGDIDPAALHRMAHAALDGDGKPRLGLPEPCADRIGPDGLCETAAREPQPGTPAEPAGSFAIEGGFAIQWVMRDDVLHGRVIRRAVYMDDRYLLEAGSGPDGRARVWPARGLMAHGLEFVTPAASELAGIEERIMGVSNVAG